MIANHHNTYDLRAVIAGALLLLTSFSVLAKSLGVVGVVFPIAEMSFLALIESRMANLSKNGALEAIEKQWVADVSAHANSPEPLHINRATKNNIHYYYPIAMLSRDILDANNQVLFKRGTQINAFSHLPDYKPHWLFFDGDDKAQVQWALRKLQQDSNAKVILTGGEVGKLEQALKTAIYFDQAGRISNQLGIIQVPAEAVRSENSLMISEFVIEESGYEK